MALLRLRLAYTKPHAPRLAEFDLMNQQLAWQAIAIGHRVRVRVGLGLGLGLGLP